MTLDNLQYALYLNNCILLDKIKVIKDAVNGITSTDIEELKKLVDYINNSGLTNIKQLITDLDTDLSNHTSDTVIHVTQDDKDLWNATLQNAKDYAKKLFDSVTSFTIEIVDTLPTENIKTMTIYFMRNEHDNESDYYEEYMYINDKWEIIGNTFINLAQYLLKADFEKYQQEIADKFAKYNTSDEIANILKDYLLTQTFNDTIKNYTTTESLQKLLEEYAKTEDIHTHDNKDIIDKLSESADGNLLFDGQEIKGGSGSDITISEEDNNAIQQKDDGIFVEDKTQEINNIQTQVNRVSIAQKTVNDVGSVSLLESPVEFAVRAGASNGAKYTNINTDIDLLDDITNYDSLKILLLPNYSSLSISDTVREFRVSNILCNESSDNATLLYIDSLLDTRHATGAQHIVLICWFKDTKTLRVAMCCNSIEITSVSITDIIGVKDRSVTIDPVEHVNTESGIEDTPVGHIISHMGNTAPKHYLICDGTEYNISDYPYLAQHFMNEFGSYNYFGGDGVNTFAVPDLRGEFLRGTGTNSHEYSGNGDNVGVHQDATAIPIVNGNKNNSFTIIKTSKDNTEVNADSYIREHSLGTIYGNKTWSSSVQRPVRYTSRPTNTSVLYCIKYEPTYYMTVGEYTVQGFEDYSEEEKIIGKWIDGRPIYRKVVKLTNNITVKDSVWVDTKIDSTNVDSVIYGCIINEYSVQHYGIWANPSTNTFNIISSRKADVEYNNQISILIIKYTKITDEENSFTPDMLSTIVMSGNKQEDLTEKELNNLITDTINLLNE